MTFGRLGLRMGSPCLHCCETSSLGHHKTNCHKKVAQAFLALPLAVAVIPRSPRRRGPLHASPLRVQGWWRPRDLLLPLRVPHPSFLRVGTKPRAPPLLVPELRRAYRAHRVRRPE
jgi:hypothetical protein